MITAVRTENIVSVSVVENPNEGDIIAGTVTVAEYIKVLKTGENTEREVCSIVIEGCKSIPETERCDSKGEITGIRYYDCPTANREKPTKKATGQNFMDIWKPITKLERQPGMVHRLPQTLAI